MNREGMAALLVQRQDAMSRRDWARFRETYAESARVESPLAGQVTGRDAIVRASEAFFTAFPDAVLTNDPPVIDGDRATIVSEVVGTHVGEILGLPATGRAFRMPIVFVIVVENNLIVHERRIYDFTGLLVQIGVLRAKPVS